MILKKTWNELLTNKPLLLTTDYDSLLQELDTLLNGKIDPQLSVYLLKSIYDNVVDNYLTVNNNNIWKELPIFVSSFKFNDTRIFGIIKLKLLQYIGFYKRVLTDEGVVRKVLSRRGYTDVGMTNGTVKNTFSEIPQVDISGGNVPDFEDLMAYVSTANKGDEANNSQREGQSELSVESKSWDEAKKNLNLVFYNTLCDYIASIPQIIYDYYSLDSYPVPEIVSESYAYLKALRDIYERR